MDKIDTEANFKDRKTGNLETCGLGVGERVKEAGKDQGVSLSVASSVHHRSLNFEVKSEHSNSDLHFKILNAHPLKRHQSFGSIRKENFLDQNVGNPEI